MDKIIWGNPPVGLFNFPIDLWRHGGAFRERGLDLEITTHLTGREYGENIRSAVFDMGHVGTPVFLPAAAGSREYAVVSVGVCDYAPFYFVASPQVESLVQLRGEPFVINKRRTCPHSLFLWHARQHGLGEADFRLRELMAESSLNNYGAAFLDGVEKTAFAGGILYEPYVSLLEREFGWRVLANYPEIARPANYAVLLYARRDWIRQQPDRVMRMVRAYFDCTTAAAGNPEQLHPYARLLPFIEPQDIDRSLVREYPYWKTGPSLDGSLLDRVEAELTQQGWVQPGYRIRDYIEPLQGVCH